MVAGTPPSCRRACVRVALRQEVRSVLPIPRPAPERERIGLPRQAADHAGIGDLGGLSAQCSRVSSEPRSVVRHSLRGLAQT